MASGTINNPLSDIANVRFAYKSGVSLNTLNASGLYMCDNCTDIPTGTAFGSWTIEVIATGQTIKQIARPTAADGYCFERHCIGGTWTTWTETGFAIQVFGDTSTTRYVRKPGNANYGSLIITGTAAGLGAVLIGITINNSAIAATRDLMTGTAWNNSALTFTYGLTSGVGYLGIKTTSTVGSVLTMVGG